MKKFVVSLLAASLIFSCCGCGGESGGSSAADSSVASEAVGAVDETSPEETVDRSQFKIKSFNTEPTIEETVLVDENGVKITATGLEYSDYEAIVHLKIENNTDVDINVYSNTGESINDFMTFTYLNCDVPSKETVEDGIDFDYDELESYGIYEIATMGIRFTVEDDDHNEIVETTAYLDTSIASEYVSDPKSYENTITDPQTIDRYKYEVLSWAPDTVFDQYGVQILSELLIKNVDGERIMMIEVINTNDVKISVGFGTLNINSDDITETTIDWDEIDTGKIAVMTVNLDDYINSDEVNDPSKYTDITQIKFNINIYSNQQTVLEDEPLTLSFS